MNDTEGRDCRFAMITVMIFFVGCFTVIYGVAKLVKWIIVDLIGVL